MQESTWKGRGKIASSSQASKSASHATEKFQDMLHFVDLPITPRHSAKWEGTDLSLGISYMGTKRHLVPNLLGIISSCRSGAFLDVFSGMCSVGRAVAPRRQVWSNDLQSFSQLVASIHFCSQDTPLTRLDALGLTAAYRRAKADELTGSLSHYLSVEHAALEKSDIDALAALFEQSVHNAQSLTEATPTGKHDLFCRRYAGTYFGYQQAIEIDSIRYAIDCLKEDGSISGDQWKALLVALCMAMSRCSNSTGHFAQSLFPKNTNIKKVSSKRKRSIVAEWLLSIDEVQPLGNIEWRKENIAFQKDATTLLKNLQEFREKPSVVYADPPYTKDQYSRYYHIYETAVLYDYPSCSGTGLYRPDRATSPFSLASKIEEAMDGLIMATAQINSCLVLSYPKNGLLEDSMVTIPKMIRAHYGVEPDSVTIAHQHSTMGASKGISLQDVSEVIYRVMI
jgi:adenine-specific DNA-methyltransferase